MKRIVGVDGGEGTPVPIPNTEVKLTCADNTWLATAREDKKMPTHKNPFGIIRRGFIFCVVAERKISQNGFLCFFANPRQTLVGNGALRRSEDIPHTHGNLVPDGNPSGLAAPSIPHQLPAIGASATAAPYILPQTLHQLPATSWPPYLKGTRKYGNKKIWK